jgi:hypothetical protein
VDPPLIPTAQSYREALDSATSSTAPASNNKVGKLFVICPALPLAYPTDPSVKLFLVNLGIPQGIFLKNDVLYKSPFGDKLVVQIFSSKTGAGGGSGRQTKQTDPSNSSNNKADGN